MDKFSVCFQGKALGELEVQAETLCTCFTVRCRLPQEGLWCVWLVGERGELRLGMPEPNGDGAGICRRFSGRMTAPLGRLLRAELRPVTAAAAEAWKPVTEGVLHSPWLRQQLCTAGEVLFCRAGDCLQLAVPFDSNRPFPMPSLFCFARIRQIRGREYAIFAFDRENWPVFIE